MTTPQEFWDGVKAEMPKVNVWVIRYAQGGIGGPSPSVVPEIADEAFREEVLELIKLDGFIGEANFSPPDMYDEWTFKAEVEPSTICQLCETDFATASTLDQMKAECGAIPPSSCCYGKKAMETARRKATADALRKKLDFPAGFDVDDKQILFHTEGTFMRWGVEVSIMWKRFVKALPCPHVHVYRGGTGMMGDEYLECLFCGDEAYPESLFPWDRIYANLERAWKKLKGVWS